MILVWLGDTGSVLVGGWGHWRRVLEGARGTQGEVTGAGIQSMVCVCVCAPLGTVGHGDTGMAYWGGGLWALVQSLGVGWG